MNKSIDHLASYILRTCFAIEKFALDAKFGRIDNIDRAGARVDAATKAVMELLRLIDKLQQHLTATIDQARAI